MLTTAELLAMRFVAELTMTELAAVKRDVPGDSHPDGSPIDSPVTVIASVKLRIAPSALKGAEGMAAARIDDRQAWTLTFPALTDIRPQDLVEVGARRFKVMDVLGPQTVETERVTVCEEAP